MAAKTGFPGSVAVTRIRTGPAKDASQPCHPCSATVSLASAWPLAE